MRRKWYLFITCIACICLLSPQANAQTTTPKTEITIEFNNERLPSLLKRLEKVSGYKILFTYDDIKKYTVSGSAKNKGIKEILEIILNDKPLEYHIEDQFITITSKNSKQPKIFDVTGTVISQDDGLPLIGATILIKGSKTGVLTDIDGRFHIEKVASNSILQFSYIGMVPQEVKASPKMNITLP